MSSSVAAARRWTSSARARDCVTEAAACGRPLSQLRASGVPRSYVHEARRRVGPKRARLRAIVERLAAAHPDATIALSFRNDLELLVSVMLSAQTTDVNVNRVTEKLFEKYRRPE